MESYLAFFSNIKKTHVKLELILPEHVIFFHVRPLVFWWVIFNYGFKTL